MAEVQEESCREVHPPDQKVMSWLRACIAFGCASRHFPFAMACVEQRACSLEVSWFSLRSSEIRESG